MAKKSTLEGWIDLKRRKIVLDQTCFGKELDFTINSKKFCICIPNVIQEGKPYEFQVDAKSLDTQIVWEKEIKQGYKVSTVLTTGTKNELKAIECNGFIIKSKDLLSENELTEVSTSVYSWIESFVNTLEIVLFTDFETEVMRVEHDNSRIFTIADDNVIPVKNRPINIAIATRVRVSFEQLSSAVEKLENGYTFDCEYYINFALKHLNNGSTRQCLVDSATAVELALSELFFIHTQDASDQVRSLLNNRYSMISHYRKGLKLIGVETPHEIIKNVAEPRNKTVHEGINVTKSEARLALDTARSFVYDFLAVK